MCYHCATNPSIHHRRCHIMAMLLPLSHYGVTFAVALSQFYCCIVAVLSLHHCSFVIALLQFCRCIIALLQFHHCIVVVLLLHHCGFVIAIVVSPLHWSWFCCCHHGVTFVITSSWYCHHSHIIVVPLLLHHCGFVVAVAMSPSSSHHHGVVITVSSSPSWCHLWHRICYDTDCSIGTDYDTASVRKRPRTYLGITICLPFIFDSTQKVPDSCTVQENSVADGSASEALQTSCTVQGLCTVHGDVLPSLYCTWRRSPFSVRYIAMPHSHTCIKGS